MASRIAWLAGSVGVAAVVLYRARSRTRPAFGDGAGDDPRAEELRRKLAESRGLAEEREQFESAETPVDQAESRDLGLDRRRGEVHEAARAAAEQMRRSPPDG